MQEKWTYKGYRIYRQGDLLKVEGIEMWPTSLDICKDIIERELKEREKAIKILKKHGLERFIRRCL